MKLLLLSPLLLFSLISNCQLDSIDLRKYCPTQEGQDESAICFAYAPAYSALSIMHNIRSNNTDQNSTDYTKFSFGFVASMVKKEKGFFGKMFNRCGRSAKVDDALGVLLRYGTVPYSDFTQNCACGKVDEWKQKAQAFKIKDTSIIGSYEMDRTSHLQEIKSTLQKRVPVIVAINQEDFFRDAEGTTHITFPDDYVGHNEMANHVVCIVGYDDKKHGGSFIVKNNYIDWGSGGFSYVSYSDMMKIISWSYAIVL